MEKLAISATFRRLLASGYYDIYYRTVNSRRHGGLRKIRTDVPSAAKRMLHFLTDGQYSALQG